MMPGAVVMGVLLTGHKGPAVEVPFDPAQKWGARQVLLGPGRRGYAVEVVLNRARFLSAIVSRMRRFFVLVPSSVAQREGVSVGDHVRLSVTLAEISPPPAEAPPAKAAGSKRKATLPAKGKRVS
jgi:Domain of unknown function (DUF1905)